MILRPSLSEAIRGRSRTVTSRRLYQAYKFWLPANSRATHLAALNLPGSSGTPGTTFKTGSLKSLGVLLDHKLWFIGRSFHLLH